jgi:hypothetical protein
VVVRLGGRWVGARLRAWRLREEEYGVVVGLGLRGIRVGIGWATRAASRFPPIPSAAGRGCGSNPSLIWVGIGRGEVRFGCGSLDLGGRGLHIDLRDKIESSQ